MTILKKEAIGRRGIVQITANTEISTEYIYASAEKKIVAKLKSAYNIYTGNDYDQLISAWHGIYNPKQCDCTTRLSPEYGWLISQKRKDCPILLTINSIYVNTTTQTWWVNYVIADSNFAFARF